MSVKQAVLIFLIALIALSPLLELFDYWEQWGRDSDFETLLVLAAAMIGLAIVSGNVFAWLLQLRFVAETIAVLTENAGTYRHRPVELKPTVSPPLLFLILCDLRI